jgi:hypothetical protein
LISTLVDRLSWSVLFAAVCVVCVPRAVAGEDGETGVQIDHVFVGFDGYYKLGKWTPIEISVTADGPGRFTLVVQVVDGDGNPAAQPVADVEIPGSGSHTFHGVFMSGRLGSPLVVSLTADGAVQASRTLRPSAEDESPFRPGLRQSTLLVLTVGQVAGFGEIEGEGNESNSSDPTPEDFQLVELAAAVDALPAEPGGLDGVDVVVVGGHYEQIDTARSRALGDWVRNGGHLIVALGAGTEAYQASQLAAWIPVKVTGPTTHRELSGLESYSGRNVPIRPPQRGVPGARLDVAQRRITISGRDGPLVARVPYAFGHITFLSIDLDRPPLSTWRALPSFMQRLLGREEQPTEEARGSERRQLTDTGITDLATQLHGALDHFPAVRRLSTVPVMALMLVYLIVIGPIDYLIVHRLLKRPQLTWVTFPLLVVAAAALSAWGAASSGGAERRLNELSLVDADEETGLVRSTSWTTLYSPQTARYAVELQSTAGSWSATNSTVNDAAEQQRLAFTGIPEDAFGGLYRAGGSVLGQTEYHFGRAASIEDLPISIWGSKSLTATGRYDARELVESRLESIGIGKLLGEFSHRLPAPIDDWMLTYRDRVYFPKPDRTSGERPSLAPHRKFRVESRSVDQRMLAHFLTGTVTVRNETGKGDKFVSTQAAYDPLARDPQQILRMVTFYQLIGGKTYTRLDNDSLRVHDFSPLLALDRAVLFGRLARPAVSISVDGAAADADQSLTFVRLVMPVNPAAPTDGDRSASSDGTQP